MKHFGTGDVLERRKETSKALREASKSLMRSFIWDESQEGHVYWEQQYDHLNNLAEYLEQDI